MKRLNTKTHFGSYLLHLALCILLTLLSACGSGSDSSDETSSDTGSITFSLVWEGATSERSAVYQAAVFDCAGNGVDTVEATVYDQNDNPLMRGGPWNCTDGEGTITGVPVGDNRQVVVFGKDSNGNGLYRGESSPFPVTAAGPNGAGTITMNYVGDTLLWDEDKWNEKNWG